MSTRQQVRPYGAALAALVVLLGLAAPAPRAGAQSISVTVTLPATAVRFVLTPANQSGTPGSTVVYTFGIYNSTTIAQTFQLTATASAGWKATLPQNKGGKVGPLSPGQTANVPVAVLVPKKARIASTGWTTLKATTTGKAKLSDQGTVTTTVAASAGLSLAMAETQVGRRGETVSYPVSVTNETDRPQQVTVRGESGHGWVVKIGGKESATVLVPAGGAVELVCQVAVPKQAESEPDLVVVYADLPGDLPLRVQAAGVTTIE